MAGTDKPMHIAIVSPEFPPAIGGVETYALEYSRALAELGHRVTVHTLRHPQDELRIDGIEVKQTLRMRLHEDRRTLATQNADAWHAMNAACAWLVGDHPGLVVSVHGNDFLRPYYPLAQPDWKRLPGGWRLDAMQPRWLRPLWISRTAALMKRALPKARHILANSRYTEQALLTQQPRCAGRTSVAYVGVAEKFFNINCQPRADGVKRLLTVCRLSEPRKNVESVLRALAKLRDEFAFRYTVVGDGADRLRLQALSDVLGLTDRVDFAGFVSEAELHAHYAQADLFILASSIIPNSHEGFGIVYLEAAASGVPSLAARLAGAAEAVEENVSGMFVEEPTTDALANALRQFLNGSKSFDSGACRDFARRFTWRRVVEHALPYY
jgi:glycosyltransferase involved in cell wall biosynthesis